MTDTPVYAVNIAVKRGDKVESDTLYTQQIPTLAICQEACRVLDADGVIMSVIGELHTYGPERIKEITYMATREVQVDVAVS